MQFSATPIRLKARSKSFRIRLPQTHHSSAVLSDICDNNSLKTRTRSFMRVRTCAFVSFSSSARPLRASHTHTQTHTCAPPLPLSHPKPREHLHLCAATTVFSPVYSRVNLKNRSIPLSCMPLANRRCPSVPP